MKKTNRILCFLLTFSVIFLSVGLFAFAAEDEKIYYYIDSVNGDDKNSGTDIDSPIKTLSGLKDPVIKAGTHFLFKNGGEYECAVTLTCSGTKENPIVISSYGEGEKAILKTNEKTEVFRKKWIPLEERYFSACRVTECCQLCLDTSSGRS